MPQNGKAVFLIACGCAIATSTMVSEIMYEEIVRQKKYKAKFNHCKTSELEAKVDILSPDIVITTAPIDKDRMKDWEANGIHYFKGTPFLTGIGQEPIMEEIYGLLDEWGVK
jgi:galactitol-specific phosphotransferase system IIB component